MGERSFNEVRLEVVKMGDEWSGRKPPMSSSESFGKGEEMKRARPSGSLSEYCSITSNRRDEAFEGGLGSNAPKKYSRSPSVPLRSSRRILPGISGSIKMSRSEVGVEEDRYVKERGTSFERA